MNKKFTNTIFKEKYLFYFLLVINIFFVLTTKFYPSMDGPAHLYNSNLICHLIKGDSDTINSFFILNDFYIPNLTSHFILVVLNFLFSPIIAEKGLLIIYLIGITFSFRLLVKYFSNDARLSFFIFPFSYSFLFHLGFYNYSLSFIFLFYTFYFFAKNFNNWRIYTYVLLSILILLTYFTSVLTFGFLGLILGLYTIAVSIERYSESKQFLTSLNYVIRKLVALFLISLPSLILLSLFYKNASFSISAEKLNFNELSRWINDARAFIVYDYEGEVKITQQFLHIILIIVSISLYIRFRGVKFKNVYYRIKLNDIVLVPVFISLFLLFKVPNNSEAGMMSDRYILLFYMLLIIWVCIQKIPIRLGNFLVFILICLHLGLLFKHLNGTIKTLDKDAQKIYTASGYIRHNGIILPINLTDNWIEGHFSNYLGINKPMVILENYEASVGWFPVKWNTEKMPKILLNDKISIDGYQWINNISSLKTRQIDYVLIYGDIMKINESNHEELRNIISSNYYRLIYSSNDKFVNLYERININ